MILNSHGTEIRINSVQYSCVEKFTTDGAMKFKFFFTLENALNIHKWIDPVLPCTIMIQTCGSEMMVVFANRWFTHNLFKTFSVQYGTVEHWNIHYKIGCAYAFQW